MNHPLSKEQIIKEKIITELKDAEVIISGENCSFSLTIISNYFLNMGLLNRQKIIMALFQEQFQSGELHALSLKTYTKDEFQKTQ